MAEEQKELVYSLTYQEVMEILKIIDESPCQELRLEMNDFKLEVIKGKGDSASAPGATAPPPPTRDVPEKFPSSLDPKGHAPGVAKPDSQTDKNVGPPVGASPGKGSPAVGGVEVKTPLGGTFYRASAPGAPPFVEVGSHVESGDQVAIVDVMKLMNSIKSPVKGIVRQILVENETPVKTGQTLMIIEPV